MSGSGGQTYWGALPPPAVVAQRQATVRRNSYDRNRKATQLPPDAELRGVHNSPYPSEAQPGGRQNRMSQQSNTTQISQGTWIDDSVDQRGLKPRPGSWQQPHSGPYNPEAEERRLRRASRQREEERTEWEQRGGVAFNGNGYAPNRQSSHRQSNSAGQPEDFYRNNGYKPQRGSLSVKTDLGRSNTTGRILSQQQRAEDAERGIRRGSVTARKEKPEIRSAVEDTRQRRPSGRKVSEVSQEGFTSDKSPLQALETNFAKLKEEKRAKAQEAERQIREHQASGASTATRGTQNTVHFDGSSVPSPKSVRQRAVAEDKSHDISKTSAHIQKTTPRKQSSLSQPLEEGPSNKKLQKKKLIKTEQAWADLESQAHGRVPQGKETIITMERPNTTEQPDGPAPPQKVPTINEPGVQRNSSFRERAGSNLASEIILGTTTSVGRRDSNKLKKNPPTDPWRLAREDMEMQAEEIARARRAEREQRQRQVAGGPLGSSPIDTPAPVLEMMSGDSGKTHANAKKQREALYASAQPTERHMNDDTSTTQPAKSSNSQRKFRQLMGVEIGFGKPNPDIRRAISPAEQQLYADRLDRSEELGPDGKGDIYGASQQNMGGKNVQMSALTGDASNHEDDQLNARGADGRHHFSNIIRGGRGNYRPGAGLYLPDKRLDEWKSAGIASLTGALLDLDTNAQAASAAQLEAGKDKAWWEAGNKGKRRPSTGGTVRPMEAFGGDMGSEENNGTVFSDFSYSYEDITPRQGTPTYCERYGRPRMPHLVDILEADTPTRPHSTYSDSYRAGTPNSHLDNILKIPDRSRSTYSGRYGRQPISRLLSPKPGYRPGPRILERESSKPPNRRDAVSAVASHQKDEQLDEEDHVILRARNVIGFDDTSKRECTVKNRNRSLLQPKRFSRKKSTRRQKGPPVVTSDTKLSKNASFMKDCRHPERHNIFHPFHTCNPSIYRLQSKRKPSNRKHKLTNIVIAPTKFSPPLYLKCGPLLRYTGIRREALVTRPGQPKRRDREIWRGSVMIVTTDAASSYSTPPTLRLFAQPKSLLPPPPETLASGEELPHEYIDPIAGHTKCGRNGQTLYVRPVEFLPEEVDLSRDESDKGLFSRTREASSSTSNGHRPTIDGEKLGKTVSVKGFRLHAERGATFWRFNMEVELTKTQQRIAYCINGGPATGFWVPALGEGMNIMNYSCNGFSMSVNADSFSGPDPLWRDVLSAHQTRPFHVMIGGGDQVYNDCVIRETSVFAEWLAIKNPLHKHNAPFTTAMQDELDEFYLERYAMWFSQGLFGLANSQIPMVNVWDDHDIIDGFGSYPHHFMDSPVFTGLGAIAFKYYMLFQQQSSVDEGPANEPSWLLGPKPGLYIKERSRSLFMSLGGGLSFLGLDCRTERTRDEILSEQTYDAILDRCYSELVKGTTTHLIVLLGVPIAYPRLVWLENILTSRIMDPIKALSRAGAFGNLLNNFDGGVEILDDLDDHWTAKNHKVERRFLIQDLQDLAASKSVRITILSGDVHLAAIGQFFSSKNEDGTQRPVPKDKDHRYMLNVISSAIVNTPPPDMLADVLARRDKIHHLDGETDENMITLFGTDVDGKKRNNKVMLPRRNWASIRVYDGSSSPPGTPDDASRTPSPEKGGGFGGLVRRLSMSRNDSFVPGPNRRQDSFGPRPPISGGGGGLLRRLSTSRGRPGAGTFDGAGDAAPPKRSSSTGGIGGLIRRLSQSRNRPPKRRDRSGINGYESETEEEYPYKDAPDIVRTRHGTFLRGGAAGDYSDDGVEYQGLGLRGGSKVSRSEERIERNQEYFAPKRGYRRGEEDPNDSDAAPPPIRTGGRGSCAGRASLPRSDTYSDSRYTSVAPISRDGMAGIQRSNTTNTFQKSMHRTPTGLSTKGGLFGKKAGPEPINLQGGLEITLNVEVNKKDPAGITAPYRLLVPRLWYEEPVRPLGNDGAMEDLPAPPLKRGNSFSGGLGGLMRRLSTTKKATPAQTPQFEQGDPINDQSPDIRVGEGGFQHKSTVRDRMKGVFGLGRRRSMESYSGSEAESYDEHADTRLVPPANYGKKATRKQPAPAAAAVATPALIVASVNRGPLAMDDDESEISRAQPVGPAAPELPAKPAAYKNEPPRTPYRDLNTEATLERRASLDRPEGGVPRKNKLSDKLKVAMGLGRRDSVGSYTGSVNSYEELTPPPPKRQEVLANSRDSRGPYPSLQQQQAAGRTSLDRSQRGVKRGNSLGGGLKKSLGLSRRESVESWSGSDVEPDNLPANQRRAPPAEAAYSRASRQQQMRRVSMDAARPQKQERKNPRGGGLMRAMGLGRREEDYSEGSYTGSEDESELQPQNNTTGQRINPAPLDLRDPSLSQRQHAPPRASMDTGRPQAHPRRTSLGGGLKAALGLGGGRRETPDYSSYTESDDESIARRQTTERSAATGDRRYPSLPQGRPPSASANAGRAVNPGSAAPRASLHRRESGRRVDSRPFPPQRKDTMGGRLGKMIGLGRRSPTGSFSGSEHSWSQGEEAVHTMPRGDERSIETDEEGGRGFKKVSGTKVERGQMVGGGVRREGESGFTRQERQRARTKELGQEMDNPGPKR